jgi:hypothetical protein
MTVGARAQTVPDAADVGGKYARLVQVMPCPADQATYGEFRDYGRWEGGAWCGSTGKPGYWVWVAPNWYVWGKQIQDGALLGADITTLASAHNKYAGLIQIMRCPTDQATYGEFRDYGRWEGGAWCGGTGKPGYWVWVAPNWYVWHRQR